MKITDYSLNLSRADVAAWYELKAKHEERSAILTIILILLGIFVAGPLIMMEMAADIFEFSDKTAKIISIFVILILIIFILALCIMLNSFRAGRLFRFLRKHEKFEDMISYIEALGENNAIDENNAMMHVAYLMTFHQYQHAYLTGEQGYKALVIAYNKDGHENYYSTYNYTVLCDNNCENATLIVDSEGIRLIDKYAGGV